MSRLVLAVLFLFAALPAGAAFAKPDLRAIVFIVCTGPDGKITSGSGVIVSRKGHVLTAKHVVPVGYKCRGNLGSSDDPTRNLILRKNSYGFDAALMQFNPQRDDKFEIVCYREIDQNTVGEEIHVYGYPRDGNGISMRPGFISTGFADEKGNVEITALTTFGMSGGPGFRGQSTDLFGIIAGAKGDPITGNPSSYALLSAEILATELGLIRCADEEKEAKPKPEPKRLDAVLDDGPNASVDASLEWDLAQEKIPVELARSLTLAAEANGSMRWMNIAIREYGTTELKGAVSNKRIMDYARETDQTQFVNDDTSWNALFLNWVLLKAGFENFPAQPLAGRNWLQWGTRIQQPEFGAIAIFSRSSHPSDFTSTVGFITSFDGRNISILGGNVRDAVGIAIMPRDRLLAIIRPGND